jgi:acyl carrier protein
VSESAEFEGRVFAIIADTFSADPATITRRTTADDVDGWDSLGHSILLARLSQKLGLEIGEEIAGQPSDVGELVDLLEAERNREPRD